MNFNNDSRTSDTDTILSSLDSVATEGLRLNPNARSTSG